ncbi:hypothetical protein MXB_4444 [Myxobolus squamalis]|nr:hypothetical protein MXB_4444 [Myxobolus squamalis]
MFEIIFAVPSKVKRYYEVFNALVRSNSVITDLNIDNFDLSKILIDSRKFNTGLEIKFKN